MLRLFSFILLLAPALASGAENPLVALKPGDNAPIFAAQDDSGKPWNLQDHVGKTVVVVYFYPADMTSVCTRQACSFRDSQKELKQAGVTVVGVSGDSVNNHQLFKQANGLNFSLLADPRGKIAKAFGVPVRRGGEITRLVAGKEKRFVRGVTARRWTFVIGLDGRIVNRNTDVNAAASAESVLKVVRQLTTSAR